MLGKEIPFDGHHIFALMLIAHDLSLWFTLTGSMFTLDINSVVACS